MRSWKSLILVTAMLLLVPAATASANGGWTLDVRGGVGLPMGDFGDSFKSGLLIGVEASKMMTTNLALGLDGNYMKNKGDEAIFGTGSDVSAKFMHYGVHGKYMLGSSGSKTMPYLVAGAGLYNSKFDDGGPGSAPSSTDFGLRGGIGMNMMMSPKMGLGFQADYNDIMTDGGSSQYVGLSAGLHWNLTSSSNQ